MTNKLDELLPRGWEHWQPANGTDWFKKEPHLWLDANGVKQRWLPEEEAYKEEFGNDNQL